MATVKLMPICCYKVSINLDSPLDRYSSDLESCFRLKTSRYANVLFYEKLTHATVCWDGPSSIKLCQYLGGTMGDSKL